MKKILALMLSGILVISISGCSKSNVTDGISDIISKGAEYAESNNEKVFSEISYKMASIYDVRGVEGDYKNWMSFAIEVTSQWYELYDIKVTNNGSEIDGSVDILTGSVCIDDKFHRFDSSLTGSEYDNFLYTIIIKTNDDISVDDIAVNATTHYNSVGSGVSENMSLIVNSNISEITTRQSVIHENTLFEVDGTYYVFNSGTAGVGYKNGLYSIGEIYKLRPQDNELNIQQNEVSLIKRENGGDYSVPSGYELYYSSQSENADMIEFYIGLSNPLYTDGADFPDEIEEEAKNLRLKYTDDKGSMILLIP